MASQEDKNMEKWEVADMIRQAIDAHEIKKEGEFVRKYEMDLLQKDNDRRISNLEDDSTEAKDRNKWLFRLVIGAILTSLIPIVIALLSQSQGSILR